MMTVVWLHLNISWYKIGIGVMEPVQVPRQRRTRESNSWLRHLQSYCCFSFAVSVGSYAKLCYLSEHVLYEVLLLHSSWMSEKLQQVTDVWCVRRAEWLTGLLESLRTPDCKMKNSSAGWTVNLTSLAVSGMGTRSEVVALRLVATARTFS